LTRIGSDPRSLEGTPIALTKRKVRQRRRRRHQLADARPALPVARRMINL
jgi:hypothetical protein